MGHSFYLNFLPDPTTFEGALAVLIVGSLIVAAILGGLRWYLKRRQRKAKEAEARREARVHLRAGVQEITVEMRANAELLKRFEAGHQATWSDRKTISRLQWHNFHGQIAGLRAEDPELWRELVGMDGKLDMARHGQKLPSSDDLLRLADRLDKAAE